MIQYGEKMSNYEQKKPLISVIIPFYKGDKYVRQAVRSVLNQPYQGIELILINDGSPTGNYICESIAKTDDRIKYFLKQNEGIGATRNFGIEHASGAYLAFLDQDDVWVNNFLTQNTVKKIIEGGDIVGFSFFDCNNDLTRGNLVRMNAREISGGGSAVRECKNHHSSLFTSSDFLKRNRDVRYALTRHEDIIYIQKALYLAKKITYIDKTMFLYRNNYTSETHRKQYPQMLFGPLLKSWKELLVWHEKKHTEDIEIIKFVKHMICVYAFEGVEALYQTGIDESRAEKLIDEYLCRDFLDNYEDIVLSENRRIQIANYYQNRESFIRQQRKMGRRARFKSNMKALTVLNMIYDKKKYQEIIPREYVNIRR